MQDSRLRRLVKISAPSRLHFGLLRFACSSGPSYGGLGMMIDRPGVEVELARSTEWHAEGPGSERALALARQASMSFVDSVDQPLYVRVVRSAKSHSGLGSGTQLALAVAKGVDFLIGGGSADLERLVSAVGRGQRGAVGSYGFADGGLIWEKGKSPGEHLASLSQRVELPEQWRVVLVTPEGKVGLSGDVERKAFAALPAVPQEVTEELIQLAEQQIIPAAEGGDFESFSEATYQYGLLAGNCFAAVQGGPFSSPEVATLVQQIRGLDVAGVGQSSWGPIVFAFTQGTAEAQELVKRLESLYSPGQVRAGIALPDNRGARIELRDEAL